MSVEAPLRIEQLVRFEPERTGSRSVPSKLAFPMAVSAAIVAMFAPYLRAGVLLGLDTPVNLVGPYPRASMLVGARPPALLPRAPVDVFLTFIYRTLPWGQVRLLPLVAAVVLAAWGFSRLFRERALAAFGATLFFVTNPFMYERVVAGQEFFVLGVSLMPLLLSVIWNIRSRFAPAAAAALLVSMVALSLHMAFLGGATCGIYLVSYAIRRRWVETRRLILAGALAVAGSLYWIIPAVGSWGRIDAVPLSDLAIYRSSPDPRFGLWGNLVGLYGFWRRGWPLPKDGLPWWPLFLLAILLVGAVGVAWIWTHLEQRRRFAPLLVLGALGLFLAAGDQGLTGDAYAWAFQHVAIFRVMREPEKWLALLTLTYAVAFGEGLERVVRGVLSAPGRWIAAATALGVVAVYGYSSFWGAGGYERPSPYPASWVLADARIGQGPGLVVALPWQRYVPIPWAGDRVVSNPMVSAFRREVVISNDPGLGGSPPDGPDPTSRAVGQVLDRGRQGQQIALDLQALGVRYIALAKIDDWAAYSWLRGEHGITKIGSWSDLVVFEVAPAGSS